jgi:hypothetical protein
VQQVFLFFLLLPLFLWIRVRIKGKVKKGIALKQDRLLVCCDQMWRKRSESAEPSLFFSSENERSFHASFSFLVVVVVAVAVVDSFAAICARILIVSFTGEEEVGEEDCE